MSSVRSPIAWRLTLWFLLLSTIPIAVMAIFVRHTVADTFVSIARRSVEAEAQVIGTALSNLPRDDVLDTLEMAVADRGHGVAVVDGSGYLLNALSGGRIRGPEPYPKELIELVLTDEPGSWVHEETGAIFGFAPVAYRDHYVIVAQNPEVVSAPIAFIERSSFVQLAVSLAIVAVAGGAVIWIIIGPIQQLTAAAEEIGRGNLDVQVDAEDMEGELRVLTEAFNDMARQLRASYSTLEQQVADRTRELDTLNRIASAVGGSLDVDATLDEALRTVLSSLDYRAGAICLANEESHALCMVCQEGFNERMCSEDQWSHLAGSVVASSEPAFLSLTGDGDEFPSGAAESAFRLLAAVPLSAGGRVEGVLLAASTDRDRLPRMEMELLTSIGHQIGIGVQNSRLHVQSQDLLLLEERQRLARDLHDSVTQSLYGVLLYTEAAARKLEAGEESEGVDLLRQARQTAQESLQEMRLLIFELRPAELHDKGIIEAVRGRLEAVEGRAGVAFSIEADEDIVLDPALEEELYRIAIESLNNSLKHAEAGTVSVSMTQTGANRVTVLEVRDDGVGMDIDDALQRGGMGLRSMTERAESIGGQLTIDSTPGEGTRVRVEVTP